MGRAQRYGSKGALATLLVAGACAASGCGPKLNPGGEGGGLRSPGCEQAAVTYATGASAIVNASCALSGCHVQGGISPNLSTATGAKAGFVGGGLSMAQVGTMPSAGKLPAADLCVLENWAEGGYLP